MKTTNGASLVYSPVYLSTAPPSTMILFVLMGMWKKQIINGWFINQKCPLWWENINSYFGTDWKEVCHVQLKDGKHYYRNHDWRRGRQFFSIHAESSNKCPSLGLHYLLNSSPRGSILGSRELLVLPQQMLIDRRRRSIFDFSFSPNATGGVTTSICTVDVEQQ